MLKMTEKIHRGEGIPFFYEETGLCTFQLAQCVLMIGIINLFVPGSLKPGTSWAKLAFIGFT